MNHCNPIHYTITTLRNFNNALIFLFYLLYSIISRLFILPKYWLSGSMELYGGYSVYLANFCIQYSLSAFLLTLSRGILLKRAIGIIRSILLIQGNYLHG